VTNVTEFLCICLGGAVGTGARHLLSGWVLRLCGPAFPFGTLAVNVLGSFLLGLCMYAGVEVSALSPTTRLALTTGVMGGFTTFSAFSFETMRYVQQGAFLLASLNVVASVLCCLAACFLGWATGRWLFGT
jgi:CrcB protein